MIDTIQLKFGRAPGAEPLHLRVGPITVFVGPNNAGKSRLLKELEKFCRTGRADASDVILDSVTFSAVSEEDLPRVRDALQVPPGPEDRVREGHLLIRQPGGQKRSVPETDLERALRKPDADTHRFCGWYVANRMLVLDGRSRMEAVAERAAADLQQPPVSCLDTLLKHNAKRERVRRVVHEATGLYLVVDPTKLGWLRVRFSKRPPSTEIEERGIGDDAVRFHGQALAVDEVSDGVRAFSGVLAEIIAGDPEIVLIDEPEAFLHPALAFTLGKEIAGSAAASHKRVFVATHSASFVMGCVQSGAQTDIIRLTYQRDVGAARLLSSDRLLRLMRNPLLRSTGVLNGLFYESVIVTEADCDRAFYQEINERLLREERGRGIPNCLFPNAQNKQTIWQVVKPLRELGIPAAAIVDLDILYDQGSSWKQLLESCFLPDATISGLSQSRGEVAKRLKELGSDVKATGIHSLGAQDREAVIDLLDQLKGYGLFVVDVGEVECWLPSLGLPSTRNRHGPSWLPNVFEQMGEDPEAQGYVHPAEGDVWEFISGIRGWLTDPERKGIPA